MSESIKKSAILPYGYSKQRLYKIYHRMIYRCNSKGKKYYSEKGISVCSEWKESYINFYLWAIKNGYNDTLTIDRIDCNGNYEPKNCRWVTYKVQNNNRSDNVFLTYNNKTQTMAEWSDELKIPYETILKRHKKYGSDVGKILNTQKYNNIYLTYQGKTLSLIEWSKITGLSRGLLYQRYSKKWNVKDILTKPLGELLDNNNHCKKVRCVETGVIYKSIAEAARLCKCNQNGIIKSYKNNKYTSGGYHWELIGLVMEWKMGKTYDL